MTKLKLSQGYAKAICWEKRQTIGTGQIRVFSIAYLRLTHLCFLGKLSAIMGKEKEKTYTRNLGRVSFDFHTDLIRKSEKIEHR